MDAIVTLGINLKKELMTTVRLTTGGVCSCAGLSYDDGEDCKVCVTESLLMLAHCGYTFARVAFYNDGGLYAEVQGECDGGEETDDNDEISVALLNALAQGVVIERSGGKVRKISFRFSA